MYSLKLYKCLKKKKKQLSKKNNYTAAIAVAYRGHVVEHAPRPNQASVHTSTPASSQVWHIHANSQMSSCTYRPIPHQPAFEHKNSPLCHVLQNSSLCLNAIPTFPALRDIPRTACAPSHILYQVDSFDMPFSDSTVIWHRPEAGTQVSTKRRSNSFHLRDV